ncbi:hypothetical protein ACFCYN_05050 [Gottfriedia sp. NPDC056225]|uniref:hypothetical protein n=1 Tax=Gottfriedia sp. NPDC056225 TaxID=3345751 RepID=UPI0035D83B7A
MMKSMIMLFILGKLLLVQSIVYSGITLVGFLFSIFIVILLYLLPTFLDFNKRELHIGYSFTSLVVGAILLICTVYERYAVFSYSSLYQTEEFSMTLFSFFMVRDLLFIFDFLLLPYFLLFKEGKINNLHIIKMVFRKEIKGIRSRRRKSIFNYSQLKNITLNEE